MGRTYHSIGALITRSAALGLLMILLAPSTGTAAVVGEDEDVFDKKMLPFSWNVSLGGGAGWDTLIGFTGNASIDAGFGKHVPNKKNRSTRGDWLGLALRFDTGLRFLGGMRYGYVIGWDRHATSFHLSFNVTGGVTVENIAGRILPSGWFGFEEELAILFRVGRPRTDRRAVLGPVITLRELPIPGSLEVQLSLRFGLDTPMLHEEDLM